MSPFQKIFKIVFETGCKWIFVFEIHDSVYSIPKQVIEVSRKSLSPPVDSGSSYHFYLYFVHVNYRFGMVIVASNTREMYTMIKVWSVYL